MYMFRFIINFLIVFSVIPFNQSLANNNLIELTCFTEFIDDKPSQRKVPIFFSKINLNNNDFYWSDIDRRIIKLDITSERISVIADSGVQLRKAVQINRINGSFLYIKPTLKTDGSLAGGQAYEGKCEVGIKKKLFWVI